MFAFVGTAFTTACLAVTPATIKSPIRCLELERLLGRFACPVLPLFLEPAFFESSGIQLIRPERIPRANLYQLFGGKPKQLASSSFSAGGFFPGRFPCEG